MRADPRLGAALWPGGNAAAAALAGAAGWVGEWAGQVNSGAGDYPRAIRPAARSRRADDSTLAQEAALRDRRDHQDRHTRVRGFTAAFHLGRQSLCEQKVDSPA